MCYVQKLISPFLTLFTTVGINEIKEWLPRHIRAKLHQWSDQMAKYNEAEAQVPETYDITL